MNKRKARPEDQTFGVQQWICKVCDWRNLYIRTRCRNCGAPRTAKQEKTAIALGWMQKTKEVRA